MAFHILFEFFWCTPLTDSTSLENRALRVSYGPREKDRSYYFISLKHWCLFSLQPNYLPDLNPGFFTSIQTWVWSSGIWLSIHVFKAAQVILMDIHGLNPWGRHLVGQSFDSFVSVLIFGNTHHFVLQIRSLASGAFHEAFFPEECVTAPSMTWEKAN